MINWFKNMRKKQEMSDKLLKDEVENRTYFLRKKVITLVKDYIKQTNNLKEKYNITDEELK